MGEKKIWSKILVKNFGQKFFASKYFLVKKIFGSKKFLGQKIFGSKSFCQSKIFWVIKILGKKIFWVKKFWAKKVWSKDLDPEFFLSKKTGRVKPRWRIYDTLPPENSRVKCVGLLLVLLGKVAYKISEP